jgi:hypothetical protein
MGSLLRKAQLSEGARWRACSTMVATWLCNHGGCANPCPRIDARAWYRLGGRLLPRQWVALVWLDRFPCYWLDKSVLSYLQQESSLRQRYKTRLLRCDRCHWWLRHGCHHARQTLLHVVLLARSYRCLLYAVRATCGQWSHLHLYWATSFIRSRLWSALVQTLSGLLVWRHLPCGLPRPHSGRDWTCSWNLTRGASLASHLAELVASWGVGLAPDPMPCTGMHQGSVALSWYL